MKKIKLYLSYLLFGSFLSMSACNSGTDCDKTLQENTQSQTEALEKSNSAIKKIETKNVSFMIPSSWKVMEIDVSGNMYASDPRSKDEARIEVDYREMDLLNVYHIYLALEKDKSPAEISKPVESIYGIQKTPVLINSPEHKALTGQSILVVAYKGNTYTFSVQSSNENLRNRIMDSIELK